MDIKALSIRVIILRMIARLMVLIIRVIKPHNILHIMLHIIVRGIVLINLINIVQIMLIIMLII